MHANIFVLFLVLLLGVGGAVGGSTTTVVIGLAVSPLCLTPALLGARVDDSVLEWGYRFRRRRVDLSEVVGVTIGRIPGFGLHSVSVMGLSVELASGDVENLPESAYCSRRRLNEWAQLIKDRRPGLTLRNL